MIVFNIMIAAVEQEYADALWAAEQDRAPIAPPSEADGSLTVEGAYAIQAINVARRTESGARVLGRKVGLTSRAMQEMLGVDEPDFGVLMDDMFVEEGDDVELGSLILPRVEAEMAFLLERDLAGPGVTAAQVAGAVAGVLPALEIIDSRIADWRITLVDTVADNASSARVVLGGRVTPVADLDLRLVGMAVTRNGVLADTGAGAAVLGNPLRCVAWLANKVGEFGETLHAGDVVLAGALHRAFPVGSGDVCRAEFGHLGAVTARFVHSEASA
jgi:2-keto-4-pentenoate hydratase